MKIKTPLVSVIIANWNGGEVFKNCLASLSKIDYPNWELIVVDNGSTDGSENAVTNYKLIKNKNLPSTEPCSLAILKNKTNLGFAKANNQGYEKARGKYILLLNNDTKVERDFLLKLVEKMERYPSIGVVQPKIFLMDKPGYLDNAGAFLTRIGFLQHWGFGEKDGSEFDKEREIFSAKGACMLIRRVAIEKVGLFDPEFVSYFEESDFCWRVWMVGYKVLYYPKAVIYHKLGFTIRRLDVANLNYHYYKNRICSLMKNLEYKNLFLILPAHIAISFGIFLFFVLRSQFKYSLVIIKALVWNILNLPSTLKKRKKIENLRELNDRELFAHILVPVNWARFLGDFRRIDEDLRRKVNSN